MTPTVAGGTAASEWQIGSLLTKGRSTGTSIATGATFNTDVDTASENELSVLAELTGAAAGDLAVTVIPFKGDNVTPLTGITIPPTNSNGPTLIGGVVQYDALYDVSAYPKVRIAVKNNNAATQTLDLSYRLSPN
jgi:hypothetical protein